MQQAVKSLYILILLFLSMHLPFAFARTAGEKFHNHNEITAAPGNLSHDNLFRGSAAIVYDSLQMGSIGLNRTAFDQAVSGWEQLISQDRLANPSVLAIADFSQSSNQKRLYIIDMKNCRLLFHTLVAHGRNSGKEFATRFSNKTASYQSSPGFYITGQTYQGSNGYSLKLEGIEKDINDKAMQRAIVMHGADYVNESFTAAMGYIGRSQGCPAVPLKEARPIINTLKEGACLYIHTTDQQYYSRSSLLPAIPRG